MIKKSINKKLIFLIAFGLAIMLVLVGAHNSQLHSHTSAIQTESQKRSISDQITDAQFVEVDQQIQNHGIDPKSLSKAEKENFPIQVSVLLDGEGSYKKVGRSDSSAAKIKEIIESSKSVKDSQNGVIGQINSLDNTIVKQQFGYLISGLNIVTTAKQLDAIEKIDGVKSVEISSISQVADQYANENSGVPKVWDGSYDLNAEALGNSGTKFKGEGMVVAVIDSGVDVHHPDFRLSDNNSGRLKADAINAFTSAKHYGSYYSPKIPFIFNYADNLSGVDDVKDHNKVIGGHGQHVAGIVLANTECESGITTRSDGSECTEVGVKGVAPEAQLVGMKIFSNDENSSGCSSSDQVAALEDAAILGVDVINMSIGANVQWLKRDGAFETTISALADLSIVTTISAGNAGVNSVVRATDSSTHNGNIQAYETSNDASFGSPALASDVISVGSSANTYYNANAIDMKVQKIGGDGSPGLDLDQVDFSASGNIVGQNDIEAESLLFDSNDEKVYDNKTIEWTKSYNDGDDNCTYSDAVGDNASRCPSGSQLIFMPNDGTQANPDLPGCGDTESQYNAFNLGRGVDSPMNDKILVVSRGCSGATYSLRRQLAIASNLKIRGMIVIDDNPKTSLVNVMWDNHGIPQMSIPYEDGIELAKYFGFQSSNDVGVNDNGKNTNRSDYNKCNSITADWAKNCTVSKGRVYFSNIHGVLAIDPNAHKMSNFSSVGPTPELRFGPQITAPGGNINSLANYEEGKSLYKVDSGTSMAGPFVAGSAVLMLQKLHDEGFYDRNIGGTNGIRVINEVRKRFESTSDPISGKDEPIASPLQQGSGNIRVDKALNSPVHIISNVRKDGRNEESNIALGSIGTPTSKTFSITLKNTSDSVRKYSPNNSALYKQVCDGRFGTVPKAFREQPVDSFYTQKDLSAIHEYYCNLHEELVNATAISYSWNGSVISSQQFIEIPAKSQTDVNITINFEGVDFRNDTNKQLAGGYISGFIGFNSESDLYPEINSPFFGWYGDYNNDDPLIDAPAYCIHDSQSLINNQLLSLDKIKGYCHPEGNPNTKDDKGAFYTRDAVGVSVINGTNVAGSQIVREITGGDEIDQVDPGKIALYNDKNNLGFIYPYISTRKPTKKVSIDVVDANKNLVERLGSTYELSVGYKVFVKNEFMSSYYDERTGEFIQRPDGQYYFKVRAYSYLGSDDPNYQPEVWYLPFKLDSKAPVPDDETEPITFKNHYTPENKYDYTSFSGDYVDKGADCSGFYYTKRNFAVNVSLLSDPNGNAAEGNIKYIDSIQNTDRPGEIFQFIGDNECRVHLENIRLPDGFKKYLKNGKNAFAFSISDTAGNSVMTKIETNLYNDPTNNGDTPSGYLDSDQKFDASYYDFTGVANSGGVINAKFITTHVNFVQKDEQNDGVYNLKFAGNFNGDIKVETCSAVNCIDDDNDSERIYTKEEVENGALLPVRPQKIESFRVYIKDESGQWNSLTKASVYLAVLADDAPEIEFDRQSLLEQLGITDEMLKDNGDEAKEKVMEFVASGQELTLKAWTSGDAAGGHIRAWNLYETVDGNIGRVFDDDRDDEVYPFVRRGRVDTNIPTSISSDPNRSADYFDTWSSFKDCLTEANYGNGVGVWNWESRLGGTCRYYLRDFEDEYMDSYQDYYYNKNALTASGFTVADSIKCADSSKSLDQCQDANNPKERIILRKVNPAVLFGEPNETEIHKIISRIGVVASAYRVNSSSINGAKYDYNFAMLNNINFKTIFGNSADPDSKIVSVDNLIKASVGDVMVCSDETDQLNSCDYNKTTHKLHITGHYIPDVIDEIMFSVNEYGLKNHTQQVRAQLNADGTWSATLDIDPYSYSTIMYKITPKDSNETAEFTYSKLIGRFALQMVNGKNNINFTDPGLNCSQTEETANSWNYDCDVDTKNSQYLLKFNMNELSAYFIFLNEKLAFYDPRQEIRSMYESDKAENFCDKNSLWISGNIKESIFDSNLNLSDDSTFCDTKFSYVVKDLQVNRTYTVSLIIQSETTIKPNVYTIKVHRSAEKNNICNNGATNYPQCDNNKTPPPTAHTETNITKTYKVVSGQKVISINASTGKITNLRTGVATVETITRTVTKTNGKVTSDKTTSTKKRYVVKLTALKKAKIPQFTDIKIGSGINKARQTAIMNLAKYGISQLVDGKGKPLKKGKYNPQNSVNRGAMSEFIYNALGKFKANTLPKYITDLDMNRLKKGTPANKSRYQAIVALTNDGIHFGSNKLPAKFNPNATLKRSEAALWLFNAAINSGATTKDFKPKSSVVKAFGDLGKLDNKTKQAIYYLAQNGIASTDKKLTKGKFNPNNKINRGSMAEFLMKWYAVIIK